LEKLRVLVAEDHDSVRGILVSLLQSEFVVVASVGDGEKLVKAAALLRPDVIVSDILMPRKDGLAARAELLSMGIELPFVFVTMMDPHLLSPLPETISYIHKSDLISELNDSVRAVARGEIYLSRLFREMWGNP
jgi:DNA-binding NarL/FixJ family response regulator